MIRRIIYWLLIAAFLWFFVKYFGDIQNVLGTLKNGEWDWVAVAGILQVFYYIIYARLYQATFHIVEWDLRIREIFPLVLAALSINVAAPSGGAASTVLFMDYASYKNDKPGKAGAGTSLVLVIFLIIVATILLPTIGYLFYVDKLRDFEAIGAALLFGYILAFASLLLMGLRSPRLFKRFFHFIRRFVNAIVHFFGQPDVISEEWIEINSESFSEAAIAITRHIDKFKTAVGVSILLHAINILTLCAIFMAFHQPLHFWWVIAGYGIGMAYWTVSPTPQGIGVVEGVMTIVFHSLGMANQAATVVALAFRAVAFWIPLIIGFFMLRRAGSFREKLAHGEHLN